MTSKTPLTLCPDCLESIAAAGYSVVLRPPVDTSRQRATADSVELVKTWATEQTRRDPEVREKRAWLYDAFSTWCRLVAKVEVPSRQVFFGTIRGLPEVQEIKVKGERYFVGLTTRRTL